MSETAATVPKTFASSLYLLALLREIDELNTQIPSLASDVATGTAALKQEATLYNHLDDKAFALQRLKDHLHSDLDGFGAFHSNREKLGTAPRSKLPLELEHHSHLPTIVSKTHNNLTNWPSQKEAVSALLCSPNFQ